MLSDYKTIYSFSATSYDDEGNEYNDTCLTKTVYEDEDSKAEIGKIFHNFLKAHGYSFFNRNTILMESLTDEEAELLSDYLIELRKQGE